MDERISPWTYEQLRDDPHLEEPPRVGREMFQHNRRSTARREGWPDGIVEACEAFEAKRPDWYPSYHPETGWRAFRESRRYDEPHVHAATIEELAVVVDGWTWGSYYPGNCAI